MTVNATEHVVPMLIGTYTDKLPHVDGKAEGILGGVYAHGRIGAVRLLAALQNPSYLTLNAARDRAYAVSEVKVEGGRGASISAFRRDPESGDLTLINTRSTDGGQACHVALDPQGDFVLVANYETGSVVVFALTSEGGIGEKRAHVQHEGVGPNEVRQEGPHPHMIGLIAGTRDFIVPDLGNDHIYTYRLNASGTLVEIPSMQVQAAPGAGPRHVAFHPDGRHLFVLNELDNTVISLRKEGDRLMKLDTVSTLPADFAGESTCGSICVSRSGQHVFASNRGADSDSVSMLAFDRGTGALSLALTEPAGGAIPRDIALDPIGEHLLVANQDGDAITIFSIDESKPALAVVGAAAMPTPVCLLFAE